METNNDNDLREKTDNETKRMATMKTVFAKYITPEGQNPYRSILTEPVSASYSGGHAKTVSSTGEVVDRTTSVFTDTGTSRTNRTLRLRGGGDEEDEGRQNGMKERAETSSGIERPELINRFLQRQTEPSVRRNSCSVIKRQSIEGNGNQDHTPETIKNPTKRSNSVHEENPFKRKATSPIDRKDLNSAEKASDKATADLTKELLFMDRTMDELNSFVKANNNVHKKVKELVIKLNKHGYILNDLHRTSMENREKTDKAYKDIVETADVDAAFKQNIREKQTRNAGTQTQSEEDDRAERIRKELAGISCFEDAKQLIETTWPEVTYCRTRIVVGNPINYKDHDLLIVETDLNREKPHALMRQCKAMYPDMFENTDETVYTVQSNQVFSKKKTTKKWDRYILKTPLGDVDNEEILQEFINVKDIMCSNKRKRMVMPKITNQEEQITRKIWEIVLQETDMEIIICIPIQTENKRKEIKKRSDTQEAIIINTEEATYKEVLQRIRQEVLMKTDTAVQEMKKTKQGNILILTKEGESEAIRENIKKAMPDVDTRMGGSQGRKMMNLLKKTET